jgi:hypothetical protein
MQIAAVRAGEGGASQNIHTESAMRKYRMGQMMGNAIRGGVQDGFSRLAYQVGISGIVTRAPINATLKQIASEQTKDATELLDMHC